MRRGSVQECHPRDGARIEALLLPQTFKEHPFRSAQTVSVAWTLGHFQLDEGGGLTERKGGG